MKITKLFSSTATSRNEFSGHSARFGERYKGVVPDNGATVSGIALASGTLSCGNGILMGGLPGLILICLGAMKSSLVGAMYFSNRDEMMKALEEADKKSGNMTDSTPSESQAAKLKDPAS